MSDTKLQIQEMQRTSRRVNAGEKKKKKNLGISYHNFRKSKIVKEFWKKSEEKYIFSIKEQGKLYLTDFSACLECSCLVTRPCLTLWTPLDCTPPDFSHHGIFQSRILEWVTISSSRGSSQPRDSTFISFVSCIVGGFFTLWAIRESWLVRKHTSGKKVEWNI